MFRCFPESRMIRRSLISLPFLPTFTNRGAIRFSGGFLLRLNPNFLFLDYASSSKYQNIDKTFIEIKEDLHLSEGSIVKCTDYAKQAFSDRKIAQRPAQGFNHISRDKRVFFHVRDALMNASGTESVIKILHEYSSALNTLGTALLLSLLNSLQSKPRIAIEVFNWKRKQSNVLLHPFEYSKAITIAGNLKNITMAVELFTEMKSRGVRRETCAYNALMTAYIFNGLTKEALALFEDLKRDRDCDPNIVTYNILLSMFAGSMLIDHMEIVAKAIEQANLAPTVFTYNTLIKGYITAGMWIEAKKTFKAMKARLIDPNKETYSLLVRGYAHLGKLDKMEKNFTYIEDQIEKADIPVILAMIFAYSKSDDSDKLKKIERLIQLIPKDEYRPWFDVILIKNYAQAGFMDKMENAISEALQRKTPIRSGCVTDSVSALYFRHNEIEKLEKFVRQAKIAGWRLTHSVYHSRIVLYGIQNRWKEMENVLKEMITSSPFHPLRKTYLIVYRIYSKFDKEAEIIWTLKRMEEAGYLLPENSRRYWKALSGHSSEQNPSES